MARKKAVVPTYFNAVAWIALNDEDACMDPEEIRHQISVTLVADLFEKTPEEVAQDVVKLRKIHTNAMQTVQRRGLTLINGGLTT